jgi:ribonuclease P protein component
MLRTNIAVSAIALMRDLNSGVQPPRRSQRFPRAVRLLRHADFERVYKQGRRHFSASMTVFYLPRQEQSRSGASVGLRIGFTVGRALGESVVRNRMKRRLREAVRLARPAHGPDVDVVINPKKSLLGAEFSAVVNEVSRAFQAIEQKLRASNAIDSKSSAQA